MKSMLCAIFALLLFSSHAYACQPIPRGSLFDEALIDKASEAFIGTTTEHVSTPTAIRSVFNVDHALKSVKGGQVYIASESIACGEVAVGDIWLIFHLPEITCPPEAPHDPNAPTHNSISDMDENSYCMMKQQQRYAAYLLWSKNDFKREQVKDLLIQVKNKLGYELPSHVLEKP